MSNHKKLFDQCVARIRRHKDKCDYDEPEMESILWASERMEKLEEALRGVVQWSDACWITGYAGSQPHPAWGDVREGRAALRARDAGKEGG